MLGVRFPRRSPLPLPDFRPGGTVSRLISPQARGPPSILASPCTPSSPEATREGQGEPYTCPYGSVRGNQVNTVNAATTPHRVRILAGYLFAFSELGEQCEPIPSHIAPHKSEMWRISAVITLGDESSFPVPEIRPYSQFFSISRQCLRVPSATNSSHVSTCMASVPLANWRRRSRVSSSPSWRGASP